MTGIGAAIAFCSAIANAFALTLQAMEARNAPPQTGASVRLLLTLARRPRWVLGTVLVMIAWPLQIVALSFASLTVVQPILSSFQLVLLVLARFWLKERTGWREYTGALAIAGGVSLLIIAAPARTVLYPSAARLAPPLALLACATVGLLLASRSTRRRREAPGRLHGLDVTVCAGLGYAWADLVDKLVSNNLNSHRWLIAAVWLASVMIMGALAFTSEQTALQRRPASSVGPLIGALQEPLPVVLALWGGLEIWQGGVGRSFALAGGLILVGAGATVIARSPAVVGVTKDTASPGSEPGASEPRDPVEPGRV